MAVDLQLKAYAELVNSRLEELLTSQTPGPPELREAMLYSALGPGKRLRPALAMAACQAVGGGVEQALDVACAIECVHCFSLIHDDLPAIDNDLLRRGRPTCHVKFGEAIAILAGDALFAGAFAMISDCAAISQAQRLACVAALARASGTCGLVSGECSDILAEGKELDLEALESIHRRKTGALFAASCEIGAIAGDGSAIECAALGQYGESLGLAFQIADDILNVVSTPEKLGKATGSDEHRKKATYPAIIGLEASAERGRALVASAREQLQQISGDVSFLSELAGFAVNRQN